MEKSENEEFSREFDISATNSKVYFCPHCKRDLGKTAFFRHKRLYYNKRKRQWLKKPDTNRANDSSVKLIQVNLDDYPAADLTNMSNRKYIYILRCSHVSLGELITPLDLIDKTHLLMKKKSIAGHLQFHSLMILSMIPLIQIVMMR